jgi:hypothetical protein
LFWKFFLRTASGVRAGARKRAAQCCDTDAGSVCHRSSPGLMSQRFVAAKDNHIAAAIELVTVREPLL